MKTYVKFAVKYPKGCIEVNVRSYFLVASINTTKRLFKLAREHVNNVDKSQLRADLQETKEYYKDWYKRYRRSSMYDYAIQASIRDWCPRTEKQLKDVLNRLDKIVAILDKEDWG